MSEQSILPVDVGDGRVVECEVRPSRGRGLRLSVSENGVRIALPSSASLAAARRFLEKNKRWIDKHHQKALERSRQKQMDLRRLPRKLNLLAVNEAWVIGYMKTENRLARLRTQPASKELSISGKISPATVHALLRRWLRLYARVHLPAWADRLAERTGLKPQCVKIRNQKGRHGSCSGLGAINLNQQLLFYPPALVNNVILHELCHLRHRNHSRQFWSLLAVYDPKYKEHNRRIRDYEKKIPAWAQEPR